MDCLLIDYWPTLALSLPEHRRGRVLADRDALASGVVQHAGPLLHVLLRARRHGGVLVAVRLRGRSPPAASTRQAVLRTCQAHSIHSALVSRQHVGSAAYRFQWVDKYWAHNEKYERVADSRIKKKKKSVHVVQLPNNDLTFQTIHNGFITLVKQKVLSLISVHW